MIMQKEDYLLIYLIYHRREKQNLRNCRLRQTFTLSPDSKFLSSYQPGCNAVKV